jgi:hypothetical protein
MEKLLALTKSEDLIHGHLGFDLEKGHIIELVQDEPAESTEVSLRSLT